MNIYQQSLWGYQLELPAGWVHETIQDTEGFAASAEALTPNYEGENAGHLLIRGEWNGTRQPIEPLWNQHITRLSVMLGAKKLGAAPWQMSGGRGFEAEILLPKKANQRLWIGILAYEVILLHFMVSHPKEERQRFEPLVTQAIRSLRFLERTDPIPLDEAGIPLPGGYTPADPTAYLTDVAASPHWQAYDGQASIGALQAFYHRELPVYGWEIDEFTPFPNQTGLTFARLHITRGAQKAALGLLPLSEAGKNSAIVIKKH
jgi:hypothetical protein